ncbi:glycoside hydrolase family 76 protein [Falsarthrobacter nasiphocae]|uniref:Alpha-1,6-mannanase (GH76 family) n=1 Tax=Falsarthrobacter nasiphocae TaxID=189863 RepID=A0AAE3YH43_9MICC|nr:glycoside hydrolase family 76 protein [Falsarthrobacter nasiphocae]MDR6891823.1 putative alpha-1,6-mannanase (GH76 family) [Falsarthrobacter nasiphocae]
MSIASSPRSSTPPDRPEGFSTVASAAARSVIRHFGGPLLGLPGTHFAAVSRPGSVNNPAKPFHYWWQAHYVDALVDVGWRELSTGERVNGPERPSAGELASRTVKTLVGRNFFRITNSYYDDMAWAALAIGRLDALARAAGKPGPGERLKLRHALTDQLLSAATEDIGGGLFWHTKRTFKNTAATAPAALHFARLAGEGEPDLGPRAQSLVDWLESHVVDERGLYRDGIQINEGATIVEEAVYTYNQGPVLGALLELGGEANLARAARTVEAVKAHLTQRRSHVLTTHGTGDGGLFTGVLARYLALAATDERLPEATRNRAALMVTTTADRLWEGRGERWAKTGIITKPERVLVFPRTPGAMAAEEYPGQSVVELSTQLQAWMIFEAAAAIEEHHSA